MITASSKHNGFIKQPRVSKKLQNLSRIVITILFVVIVNRSVNAGQLALLFHHVNWYLFSIGVLLSFVGLVLQVERWRIVLQRFDFNVTGYGALKNILWGNLLAFITPGRVGEIFRGFSLDTSRKIDSLIAVAVDRIYALITTLIAGIFFLILSLMSGQKPPMQFVTAITILCIVGCLILIFRKRLTLLSVVFPKFKYIEELLGKLFHPKILSKGVIFFSIAAHLALLGQTAVFLSMFGSRGFLENFLIGGQAFAFMIFLPFFIANIGLREYSFGMFLNAGGTCSADIASSTVAFGVSSMILFINIILPAIVGLIWYVMERRQLKNLAINVN